MIRSLSLDAAPASSTSKPLGSVPRKEFMYQRDILTDSEMQQVEIEELRLERLRKLKILDSEEDEHFNQFVQVASQMFNAPIALINLLDSSRSWTLAGIGIKHGASIDKSLVFCSAAIDSKEEVFVVKDLKKHPKFKTNPFVKEDPKIRFYAGAPLTTEDGLKIGTLCVMDQSPRSELTSQQNEILKSLSKLVMSSLERRERLMEIEIQKQKLEASEAFKSTILSQTAHEIRTPLTSILGLVNLMLDSSENGIDELSEQQTQYLNLVKEAGTSLQQVLTDILDLSKLDASKLVLEEIKFNPGKLVADVVDFFRPKCKKSSLRCEFKPIREDSALDLVGDPTRLRQVLWNLTSNAIKFTPSGEIILRVEEQFPKTEEEKSHVLLKFEVQDSGIGMSKCQLDKICRPYQQADDGKTSRKFGGTGLGLVICNKLVNLMGGRLSVQSASGVGTMFSFTLAFSRFDKSKDKEESKAEPLPVERESSVKCSTVGAECSSTGTTMFYSMIGSEAPTLSDERQMSSGSESTCSLSSLAMEASDRAVSSLDEGKKVLRVLVADDNITIRMLMERLVKRLGHQCVMAENGEQALQILREVGGVDVFFCDMNMPVLDGPQTITALRETFPSPKSNIPVYAFSAETCEEAEESCKGLGISGVLSKPIDFNKLKNLLCSLK